jgi:hypothetical protein
MKMSGKKWTEERKREYNSGGYNNLKERAKANLHKWSAGRTLSEETKQKMSAASKGRPKSPEHAANMSKAQTDRHFLAALIREKYPLVDRWAVAKAVKEYYDIGKFPPQALAEQVLTEYMAEFKHYWL